MFIYYLPIKQTSNADCSGEEVNTWKTKSKINTTKYCGRKVEFISRLDQAF